MSCVDEAPEACHSRTPSIGPTGHDHGRHSLENQPHTELMRAALRRSTHITATERPCPHGRVPCRSARRRTPTPSGHPCRTTDRVCHAEPTSMGGAATLGEIGSKGREVRDHRFWRMPSRHRPCRSAGPTRLIRRAAVWSRWLSCAPSSRRSGRRGALSRVGSAAQCVAGGQRKQVRPAPAKRRSPLASGVARRTRAGNLAMDHLAARTSCTRETARSNGGLTKTTARWTPRSSR